MAKRLCYLFFALLSSTLFCFAQETAPIELPAEPLADSLTLKSVYVVPITGPIDKPNLYILRRALKEAITNKVDMVLLDMDTPGGRVDVTLDMMEMLDRFEGITATYVNVDAISAGSFIAASTQEIYFSPRGNIGASAVIQGGGQEIPETARQKIESYLRAKIRTITDGYGYRSEVIRAMLDAEFELKIGEEVIKPEGELLTLTAKEAMREYGEPPQALLGAGIYETTEALLDARLGEGQYEIKNFEITYSEELAKWMTTIAPALMGLGMLLLFVEFKTPGFGIFGIGGIAMIAIFFISQHVAGLAGNEAILFFALGVLLVLIELFFFPGGIIFAVSGLTLMLGSLLWSMVDVWPEEGIVFSAEVFLEPTVDLIFGLSIAFFGALIVSRLFPGSWMESKLVLADSVGGGYKADHDSRLEALPQAGTKGLAVTDLFPSGRIEIEGERYEARSSLGTIERGSAVQVVEISGETLIVEAIT